MVLGPARTEAAEHALDRLVNVDITEAGAGSGYQLEPGENRDGWDDANKPESSAAGSNMQSGEILVEHD